MNKKRFLFIGIMLLIITISIGCSDNSEEEGTEQTQSQAEVEGLEDEESMEEENQTEADEETEAEETEDFIDPATVSANELGQVMVLMYHHINEPEDTWVRTPENFRRDRDKPICLLDRCDARFENRWRRLDFRDTRRPPVSSYNALTEFSDASTECRRRHFTCGGRCHCGIGRRGKITPGPSG